MAGFIGYGLLLIVPIVNFHVTAAAGRSIGMLVMLVAFSYAVAIILQNRTRVRTRLMETGERSELAFIRFALGTLAHLWHWLARLYFAALAVVSITRPEDALPFMALATGQTLLATIAGFFVAAMLTQVISRRIHLPEETRRNFPLLEERLNALFWREQEWLGAPRAPANGAQHCRGPCGTGGVAILRAGPPCACQPETQGRFRRGGRLLIRPHHAIPERKTATRTRID